MEAMGRAGTEVSAVVPVKVASAAVRFPVPGEIAKCSIQSCQACKRLTCEIPELIHASPA
jgi:hypothetical protein